MFRIAQKQSYSWPVKVRRAESGGRFDTLTFDATFRRLPQPEVERLVERAGTGEISDRPFCHEVLEGWAGVSDENGAELAFSPTNLDRLLDEVGVAAALIEAYFESLASARRKN